MEGNDEVDDDEGDEDEDYVSDNAYENTDFEEDEMAFGKDGRIVEADKAYKV